jgi:hypothetical protein
MTTMTSKNMRNFLQLLDAKANKCVFIALDALNWYHLVMEELEISF